jgi:transposase
VCADGYSGLLLPGWVGGVGQEGAMATTAILPFAPTESAIQQLTTTDDTIIVEARLTAPTASCPCCGVAASRRQSHYSRTLADLPWQGVPVRIRLVVRRFWCDNPVCPRAIFAERVPTLATPYARKTRRLLAVLTQLGFALGGEGGCRLLAVLGMPTSADTLLRLVRGTPVAPAVRPTAVGIDDFALRRGQRYGTIIIDLATHRPVDVLPERSAEAVATWLRAHPEVATVARDRSGVYADGIRQGAPAATQVADRWHLLKNVGDVLERVLAHHSGAVRVAAAPPPVAPTLTGPVAAPPVASPREPPASLSARGAPPTPGDARQAARFAAIQALQREGTSVSAIGRALGVSRVTVRKYLHADACPGRIHRSGLLRPGSPHVAYLQERWAAGCDNAAVLWRELRARGFAGSAGTIRRFLGAWRTAPRRPGRPAVPRAAVPPAPSAPDPPTRRQVRWWLLREPDRRSAEQQAYLDRLQQACPVLQAAGELAREFGRLLRQRDSSAFDEWLERAEASGIREFASCAKSLRQDYAAVAAALREPYSNGPTEGNVTRLKLLKRQMYGRAKPDLLRQRVLHRAS